MSKFLDEVGVAHIWQKIKSYISDAVQNAGGQDVYSTEERRIGTWIDGKPLYRKVFEGQVTSDGFSEIVSFLISPKNETFYTFIHGYGYITALDVNGIETSHLAIPYCRPMQITDEAPNKMRIVNLESSGGKIRLSVLWGAAGMKLNYSATVFYTKTTDQPQT